MKPYTHTVQYYETDRMQISHHSNYVRWMEEARVSFLAQLGFPYEKLEERSIISPVVAVKCEYKHPTTFADTIDITVSVEKFTGIKLTLTYQMTLPDKTIVCLAKSSHCFTNQSNQLINLEEVAPDFYQALNSLV